MVEDIARAVYPFSPTSLPRVRRVDGKKGWWLAWDDPTQSGRVALADEWTAHIVGFLYQDRRQKTSPLLAGVALTTRAQSFFGTTYEASTSWPHPVRVYAQGDPAALRAQVAGAAGRMGLVVRSFRVPRLDGILAPVVTLEVGDPTLFKRWFHPGCIPGWVFHPTASSGPVPVFGFFLTVNDPAGRWLESASVAPYVANSQFSSSAAAQFRRDMRGNRGISPCPHPPW